MVILGPRTYLSRLILLWTSSRNGFRVLMLSLHLTMLLHIKNEQLMLYQHDICRKLQGGTHRKHLSGCILVNCHLVSFKSSIFRRTTLSTQISSRGWPKFFVNGDLTPLSFEQSAKASNVRTRTNNAVVETFYSTSLTSKVKDLLYLSALKTVVTLHCSIQSFIVSLISLSNAGAMQSTNTECYQDH